MQAFEDGTVGVWLPMAIATLVAYIVYTVIYNLYFHALAKFPGPRLAATSTHWKTYVECVASRSFCHELVDLHARYGKSG